MAFGLLVFADEPSDDGGGVSHKPRFRGMNCEISSRGPRVPMRGTEIRDRQALVAPTRKDRAPGMDGTGGISLPAVASERLIWSR